MRAISILSRDAGTSTLGCRADSALRMRVSMSAIGSDVGIFRFPFNPLPARFHHAGNLSGEREIAETDPAQVELAQIAPRAAAAEAAVAVTRGVLALRDAPNFLTLRRAVIRGAEGLESPGQLICLLEVFRDFRGSCHLRCLP